MPDRISSTWYSESRDKEGVYANSTSRPMCLDQNVESDASMTRAALSVQYDDPEYAIE